MNLMKRKLSLLLACSLPLLAAAQEDKAATATDNIDWQEDTTEIVTVKDIIREQQAVTMRKTLGKHFHDVWEYRTYLDISYATMKLMPDEDIETGLGSNGYNQGLVPDFKSKWGISLKWGRNYRLHKTAIANVAQFNIDYTWADLNLNVFEKEGEGDVTVYNSSVKFNPTTKKQLTLEDDLDISDFNKGKFYTPWNLKKYELNYGMALGPSLTLAPFTYTNVPELHFIKFNIYFHVGYHLSAILMKSNGEADANEVKTDPASSTDYLKTAKYQAYEKMANNAKIDWGHGLTKSFGFSVFWRFVGLGYENRSASVKYKSISTDDFGSEKSKFDTSLNRVYLQFRF